MLRPDCMQPGIWICLEILCTIFFFRLQLGYIRAACLHRKVSVMVFLPARMCSKHQIILHNQSVKQTLSGHFHGGFFNIILYSLGWSYIVFGAQIQILDIFSTTTTDSADKRQKDKSEKDCNYCWNMNMFKDTVEDAVCYIFHRWTQAKLWTQGAVYIRGL